MKGKAFLVSIFVLLLVFSCKKPVVLPPEPAIEFVSIRTIDTIDNPELGNPVVYNKVKFKLVDGDGDIGNEEDNDNSTTLNNTFFKLLRKQNGLFQEYKIISLTGDTIPIEYRIPVVPISGGQNKTLNAHVFILIEGINLKKLPFDTLKYEIYVKDRAGNISNTIETEEVIIPR